MAIMLLLAGTAVGLGWVQVSEAGRVNLAPWLVLEIVGGATAGTVGGAVSRRVARSYRGPAVLAVSVLTVGLLEAAEILRSTMAGSVEAPIWLVLLAPIVGAMGVLLGGWLPARGRAGSG